MSFTPFFSRDTESVIAVVEVWRQYVNGDKVEYKPVMKIQPYYKWWISEDGLKDFEEKKTLFLGRETIKESWGSSLLTGQKTFLSGVKGFLLDPTNQDALGVLGVQIDTVSKFGARAEIAFSDQDGLVYRTLKTNDIIFIWLIDLKDSNWISSVGAKFGFSIADKAAIALYYEKSPEFKIDWKKDWNMNSLVDIRNNPKSMIVKESLSSFDIATNKLKGRTLERPDFPSFAGFITVKRRHVAKSGQFRAMCEDSIRYHQHLKINLNISKNDDYRDSLFFKLIVDPVIRDFYMYRGRGARRLLTPERFFEYNGVAKHESDEYVAGTGGQYVETYKVVVLKIPTLDFFNALLDFSIASATGQKMTYWRTSGRGTWQDSRSVFYHIVVDEFIRRKILEKDSSNSHILVKCRLNLDGKSIEEVSLLSGNETSWYISDSASDKIDFRENFPTEAFVHVLEKMQGKANTSGTRVSRDPTDIYTNVGGGRYSFLDLFEEFLHKLSELLHQTKYNVRRAIWSRSISFISNKAFVGFFYFQFVGRDLTSMRVVSSDSEYEGGDKLRARFNIHRNDIQEYDIWEVNTQSTSTIGKFSGCEYTVSITAGDTRPDSNHGSVVNFGDGKIEDIATFKTCHADTDVTVDSIYGLETLKKEISATEEHLKNLRNSEIGYFVDNILLTFSHCNEWFGRIDANDNERNEVVRETVANRALPQTCSINAFMEFAGEIKDGLFASVSTLADMWQAWKRSDGRIMPTMADAVLKNMRIPWTTVSFSSNVIESAWKLIDKAIEENDRERNPVSREILLKSLPRLSWNDWKTKYSKVNRNGSLLTWNQTEKRNRTNKLIKIKKAQFQYTVFIVRSGLYAIMKLIHGLTSFGGKNGSIYMSAKPRITVGDEIILWREGGDGIIRQMLERKYADSKVGKIYDTVSRVTKGAFGGNALYGLFRKGDEGKVFIEDYKDKKNGNFIWYVWKHVIYVGNFGVTSGFTSKIYITDEPLNFGIQFLSDNVITRQLANFLFTSGLGGQYPHELRRLMGL